MQRVKTTPESLAMPVATSIVNNTNCSPKDLFEPSCGQPGVWTAEAVANRFEDAAVTARRLPSAKVQGYFNAWPTIVRCQWEMLATDERVVCRFPPTPKDVEQMLEVMLWVQWLEVE